jgi:hypothetical protein
MQLETLHCKHAMQAVLSIFAPLAMQTERLFEVARKGFVGILIEWLLVSYFPVKYVAAYHNAMADVPECRSEESLRAKLLLRGPSPPQTVRRRSSKRDHSRANRDEDTDENPPSFFVISPPPEPLDPAPRIPTPPQEPGFINGADYIPFGGSEDEHDPDASNQPNPKKRKLGAREREDRSATKQNRGGDRGGRDHFDTPWMRHLKVHHTDSISAM